MRPSPALLLAAFGLVLGSAGCSARSTQMTPEVRGAELLSSRPPPAGRACRVQAGPAELPRADQLVDIAALSADIAEIRPENGTEEPYVLFSMAYDKFGSNIRRAVIEHNISPTVADSIQKLVFKHRQTMEPSDGEWGVRMRVALSDPLAITLGRQEYCSPRPRDSQLALAMETMHGASTRTRDGYRESTIWVRLIVSPQGSVMGATVERGVLTSTNLEQRIFDYTRSLFFDPALEDGHPVSGTVSIPLVVRQR
jgi:hypothetical protein